MCTTKMLECPTCNHWWAEILVPCAEGRGFNNCPSFQNGKARSHNNHPKEMAGADSCPKCNKDDDYDGNKIRMVKNVSQGFRFGLGPSKSDPGVDLLSKDCCTVM